MAEKYCMECGARLETRQLAGEGDIPFCSACNQFRFPVFSTATSMIVLNDARDSVLLIKQYGTDFWRLVAGYVNKGEAAEHTVIRELQEELGITLTESQLSFNHSGYFAKSNTLMLNFICASSLDVADASAIHPNDEIDSWCWFSLQDAAAALPAGSLAAQFFNRYLAQQQ